MRKQKIWNMMMAVSAGAVMSLAGSQTAWAQEESTIEFTEDGILVDGEEVTQDETQAVYTGREIVYYKEGQDEVYGEGSEDDGHSEQEASEHTVLTITRAGTYRVSGSFSKGQIAVDLGEDSREDENAVVNLILDNADITCTVAPAIVVYNAYECGSDDIQTAAKEVDTGNAGFHLILADGSENSVNGSHVAKIYREGTTQEEVDAGEAKKAWKFDAAIDSLVSFTIDGEAEGDGKLEVLSDNEGIESSLHMTINGGEITISAQDDAINTNEDEVSVLTINGGSIICDSGLGKEGDGIDSNGWIVINGGTVIASANGDSQDSGLDSDLGIYLNGGTVLGSGNMYDQVSADSAQRFMVLSFSEKVEEGQLLMIKDSEGTPIAAFGAANPFQTLVYSSPDLADGDYTLYEVSSVEGELNGGIYTEITVYDGEVQLQYSSDSVMGGPGNFGGSPFGEEGERPELLEGEERPELLEGEEGKERPDMPEGAEEGERPELLEGEEGKERPDMPEGEEEGERPGLLEGEEGKERPDMPEGAEEGERPGMSENGQEGSVTFSLSEGHYIFSQIAAAEPSAAEDTASDADDTV